MEMRLLKRWVLVTLLIVCCSSSTWAQTADDMVYVFREDQPNAAKFMPAPPDSVGWRFIDDMVQWEWGKTQRFTPRGEQADRESLPLVGVMNSVMAQALGLDTISSEATPALSRLLGKAYNTGSQSVSMPKDSFERTRPFKMLNEKPWTKYDAAFLGSNYSYPSEHTAFGWATALVFAEMWPALQDTILRRGFQFGENRVIAGVHWQSDVIAGYLCAAASIARAHCNPELSKDILAARAEYARLKGLPEGFDPAADADVPHGEQILNDPVDTASYRYISDLAQYWNTKPMRDTPRGRQAAEEAEYSVAMMQQVFGQAMGITLSDEGTPAITALLSAVLEKSSETADRLKPIRFRKRPFVQLGEPSFVPGDEEKERGKSSFPSGHTNLGWTEALMLVEVAPECQDEILRRGYEYGYNRLIVGYHWFTDIEATRLLSSALVARLHADPSFCQLIADARAEYLKVTTGISSPAVSPVHEASSPRIYRIDGIPANNATQGIVIQNHKKMVIR